MQHCPKCHRNWASGRICPYCDCDLVAGSSPARCSPADSIAKKWECSIEEAEGKIAKTAEILRLGRDDAIAFLMAVHPSAIRKPENDKLTDAGTQASD